MGGAGKKVGVARGVTPRGSGIQIAFMWNGERCRETLKMPPTPPNLKYAKALRDEIMAKIVRGTFTYADYFPSSPRAQRDTTAVTVGKLLDDFIDDCDKAVANGTMSPSTVSGYRRYIKAQLRPAFGAKKLSELTALDVKEWVKGCGLTAKAIRLYLTPLRSVLADAVNLELIEVNPLHRLDLGRLVRQHGGKSKYEVNPFTRGEVAAILAVCEGTIRNLWQFAFATGLRTSELIALRWSDVDLANNVIRVHRAEVEGYEKGTKTTAGTRSVDLDGDARAALENQRQWTLLAGGRVFTLRDADQMRKTLWMPFLRRAKVTYRNPYQTRHTFASTLLSAGANPWWVAEQMGHDGPEMIYRHYGKWIPNERPKRQLHA